MGRVKTLNGIPNEVVQKYLSTLMYYDKGYMADWIWKKMNELKISEAEIDLFNETTNPTELKTKPIIAYLFELRELIQKQLKIKNFESDYFRKGSLKITIDKIGEPFGIVSIQCILVNIDNRQFVGNVYQERTYPIADSLFEKIIGKIK